ncbi:MAG TPA: hypothetical protein VKP61_00115, partial [Candidatus Acidoferrum sp.]|nr:hypothetical protein [Candidatus Acidoferrum sp.]
LWDPQRASATMALAQLYIQSGQPAVADKLLRDSSRSAVTQTASGAKRPAEDYERILQQGDASGAAANNLAWIYAQQGTNLDRALLLAQRARLLAPQNPAVLDTLGVVHLKRHEYSQAVLVLKKAIEMAALTPVADNTLIQFRQHLAEAYLRSGQTQAASALQQ